MATTGKPSISDIKSLDVRALTTAISNIRQRIEAIEGSLTTVEGTANQATSTSNAQLNQLRQQLAALRVDFTVLEATVAGLAADGGQAQIAARAFMPHVPLEQTRPASDADAQLAAQAFARRPPTLPDPALAGDNAARVLITQIFGA